MVSPFRVPYSAFALALLAASTAACVARAQENPNSPNQSAAALQSAKSINTPEKKKQWLRERYNLVMSQVWPVNFPVPVYNSNVIQTSFTNSTKGQPRAVASLVTKDPPAQVFEFYQSALSRGRWRVKVPSPKARSEMNIGNDYYFLNAEQGKQTIDLACAANPKSNVTLVTLTWQKHL